MAKSKEFPNVGEEEFRREARNILKDQLNLWVIDADFDDPDADLVERLRGHLQGIDIDELGADVDTDDINAFMDSDDVSPGYIEENADLIREIGRVLQESPLQGTDPLAVDIRHSVTVTLSFGGPTSNVTFTLDDDGDLIGAKASYAWGQSATLELSSDQAERLFQPFSYVAENIRSRSSDHHGPGY